MCHPNLPRLATIRCRAVRRCAASATSVAAAPHTRTASVARRRVASIVAVCASIKSWTLCAVKVAISAFATAQLVDHGGEFLLELFDATFNDLIWFHAADSLYIEEKACWHGVVVEGFVFGRGAAVKVDALVIDWPRQRISMKHSC